MPQVPARPVRAQTDGFTRLRSHLLAARALPALKAERWRSSNSPPGSALSTAPARLLLGTLLPVGPAAALLSWS
jgi:hypothetical protein